MHRSTSLLAGRAAFPDGHRLPRPPSSTAVKLRRLPRPPSNCVAFPDHRSSVSCFIPFTRRRPPPGPPLCGANRKGAFLRRRPFAMSARAPPPPSPVRALSSARATSLRRCPPFTRRRTPPGPHPQLSRSPPTCLHFFRENRSIPSTRPP